MSDAQDAGRSNATAFSHALSTTRVGFVFAGVSVCVLICSLVAHAWPSHVQFHSLLWIASLAACCAGGLVAMSSVRTLRTIEVELRRGARQGFTREEGESSSSSSGPAPPIRPVIGCDPIADGWNGLIATLDRQQELGDAATRQINSLDHEAVTLARAMRGLPVAWVITDKEGGIRFISPAASGMLGLSEAASSDADDNVSKRTVDRDLPQLLGLRDETSDAASADLDQLLGPIRMVHCRRRLVVDSRESQLRITRSRLAGRQGDIEGMAWVLDDVTQQRLATEARDSFLMTATHELRTPLANLQAYAEALQESDDLQVERQKEFCNVIHSEASRLGRLVDQLLTVSQMEAGSMIANRHQLELLPIVQYASDQLKAQAEQNSITIVTRVLAKMPVVFADREKLQAAIVNLLGNAVKYTPSGGEVVLRVAADERWVRIDVEDNGPGIPDDEQSKVFEKFYRCEATRASTHRGNGLGLAFAREIARLHGGDLELRSTLGEGSVFTLQLPITHPHEETK
ncbi:PAS domain-containing sensor histidine kinase [Rubripirellula reticaptiva]|uniref:histidine kinase n=1 Tax=Rubripirellula reticaptiva TaxID=2528013 RepID=A0A5C6EJ76_9BACT|nr:PAS domain-containing sensor histidine kinase [Rubripirellula reticaptiva]TWU49793.1 Sensor histidine kinase YycG [Rubripirellula reticaptiva]